MITRNYWKLLLAVLVFPLFISLSAAQEQNTLITTTSAGPVKLGMTSEDIFKLFIRPQPRWVDLDDDKRNMHLRIDDENKAQVMDITIRFEGGNLFTVKIEVYSSSYKTEKDFSPGQTYGELKKKHDINDTQIESNDVAVATSIKDQLSFKIKIVDRSLLDTSIVTSVIVSQKPR